MSQIFTLEASHDTSWISRNVEETVLAGFSVGQQTLSAAAAPPGPRCEALEDRQVPTVSFFGGNVLPHVQAQALFLGHEFSSAPANAETATLNAFLKDITGGAYMQALSRAGFNVGPGSAVAGAVDNTSLAVGSTISDAFIRSRLQADFSSGLLQAPNANTLYVVYVQPDVAVNLGCGPGHDSAGHTWLSHRLRRRRRCADPLRRRRLPRRRRAQQRPAGGDDRHRPDDRRNLPRAGRGRH